MPSYINTLIIQFDTELHPYEVPAFRGAVIAAIGKEADILFHNHQDDGFRYSYPLIQYKRIGRNAAIVCVGDGTETIGQFFGNMKVDLRLGERPVRLEVSSVRPHRTLVQTWEDLFTYRINRWVPLNEENYKAYLEAPGLIERISLLEKILIGNILSFAKGLNVEIEHEIRCSIRHLADPFAVRIKGNKVLSFDVEFTTNVSLPDFIGLGKHASFGYGVISQLRNHNHNHDRQP